jgi:hypothetical protein
MSQTKICYQSIGKLPIFKVEGKLKFSTLSCLSLLIQRYSELGVKTVIVDLSRTLTISSETEKLKDAELGWSSSGTNVVVVGPKELTRRFGKIIARSARHKVLQIP